MIGGGLVKRGALHRQLGVPLSRPIPVPKLEAAATGRFGLLAQSRARLVLALRGLASR